MRRLLDDVLGAFGLLTRLPVPLPDHEDGRSRARGAWAYPLAGAVVGALGALVWLVAQFAGFGAFLSAGLAISCQILVTGALHEDGLADFADGIGGGRDREHTLAIMRDSRIGAHGVVAIVMVLGLRWGGVAGLALHNVLAGLICAALLGRLAMVVLLAVMSPARSDGLGAMVAAPPRGAIFSAFVISAVIVFLHLPWLVSITVFCAAVLAASIVGVLAKRAIGGYTGDVLGAAGLLAELAVLLVLVAA